MDKYGDMELPCICLFVAHEYCEEIGQMLGEFATKELRRLENGEYQPVIEATAEVISKLVNRPLNTGLPMMDKCLRPGIPAGKMSEVYVNDNNAPKVQKAK